MEQKNSYKVCYHLPKHLKLMCDGNSRYKGSILCNMCLVYFPVGKFTFKLHMEETKTLPDIK